MTRPRIGAALLALASLSAAACSGPATSSGSTIVTAFYPLQYATESVVSEDFEVTTLTTPGVDAHDVELSPSQIASMADAELVVYLKGFQPAVDAAIEQSGATNVLDVSEVVDLLPIGDDGHVHEEGEGHDHAHGDFDPHFWLDPLRLGHVATAVADALGDSQASGVEGFQANAEAFNVEMATIDEAYTEGLQSCDTRAFITSHAAFGYLADRYDLTEIGITGISPNAEASPARIAEVQRLAVENHVTTIFFETLTSDAVAKSIAGDLGLATAVLDPLEGVSDNSPGDDYPSIMQANLEALRSANGCG